MMRLTTGLLTLALLVLYSPPSFARAKKKAAGYRGPVSLEILDDGQKDRSSEQDETIDRTLTSGNVDDDIEHYHGLTRRMGVDLGMVMPFGDFRNEFGSSALIGIHLTWEATEPFSFLFGMMRSAAGQKDNPAAAKLTLTQISLGAMAQFPVKRFNPFVKLEGAFHFNSVVFNNASKLITSGDDLNLTSIGANLGIGCDVIVGREVSLGLDITYHYAVPKKLQLANGDGFDLASPYMTIGLRVNF